MLDARRARLVPGPPVLAATLSQVRKRCGPPACRCHHGEPHLAWHLTYKVQGQEHRVSYVIVFKRGSIPTLWQEFWSLNAATYNRPGG